jgi:glycosyltransferase involved in cell wall biosynthesis
LKVYEKILENVDYVLPISESEHEYFNSKFQNSVYIAPFHPFSESESLTGIGDYIIFHGDLSVNENSAVAGKLISGVFSKVPYKCIIAGKDPPEFINSRACHYPNILVVPNPDKEQMFKLIVNAQINILPALASNGFKLKILFALYAGRHCIVNSVPGADDIIRSLCHVADSDEEMVSLIHLLMKQPYTSEINLERRRILSEKFDVLKNAKKLAELIYHDGSHEISHN